MKHYFLWVKLHNTGLTPDEYIAVFSKCIEDVVQDKSSYTALKRYVRYARDGCTELYHKVVKRHLFDQPAGCVFEFYCTGLSEHELYQLTANVVMATLNEAQIKENTLKDDPEVNLINKKAFIQYNRSTYTSVYARFPGILRYKKEDFESIEKAIECGVPFTGWIRGQWELNMIEVFFCVHKAKQEYAAITGAAMK